MTQKRFTLRMLTLLGLVLSASILTLAMLTFVQAQGSAASVTIVKDADQMVVRGSSASFDIDVSNSGDVTLTNVTVSDAEAPNCDRTFAELLTGEHRSYSCAVAEVTDDFVNTATVTGTTPEGGEVSHSDTASVDVIDPGIQIAKTPDLQTVVRGSSASFDIDVSNTGDVTLTNVTVSDAQAPDCNRTFGELLAGEHQSYSCVVAGVTDDFVNTATVIGTAPAGDPVVDDDTATVDAVSPAIEIAKTPDEQMVAGGDAADFAIVVTNTGDARLTNVTVTDVQAPDCDRTFASLPASVHRSYSCSVSDVRDGLINSAVVAGVLGGGEVVTDADTAKVRLSATQNCPADMFAYWWLDEGGGPTYDDYYYGSDGICAGECPTPAAGPIDVGQAFDGENTGINVPALPGDDSFDWDVDDSFSIEFWMKAESPSCAVSNEVIVGRDDSPNSQLHWWTGIGCWAGGKAAFVLRDKDGGDDLRALVGKTVVTDGSWYHVVAVRDAATDRTFLYVNGKEEASESVSYSSGFDSAQAALNIGWLDYGTLGYHFNGVVDEIAVYDRALSAEEIQRHHNEGLTGRGYCGAGTYAPTIVSTPVTEATVGRLYEYDVEAAGNPVPTYMLAASPSGMAISSATGLISWVPTVAQLGNHDVEVVAVNSEGDYTQSFTITVNAGTVCPDDIIAYWKLDEIGGGTYYDYYDGLDGTCGDQCPTPTVGHIGGAQAFDGSDTEITVPADAALDWGSDDSFSIEFWMKADDTSCALSNEVIVGRNDSTRPSDGLQWWVGIGCYAEGAAAFVLRDKDGLDTVAVESATLVTDTLWHHIVAVRDADDQENRIYVDGNVDGLATATYSSGFDSATDPLTIGWLDRTHGYHFTGIADEVALYDRALSETEIQQHYNSGEPGPGYCLNVSIEVEKVVSQVTVYPGDLVTYTYVVTNAGDGSLSSVSLSDDKCSPVIPAGAYGDNLDPDEAWTYHCSMDLTGDITNMVTVTGNHPLAGEISDTDTAFVDVIRPEIAIGKVADPALAYLGDTVIYTYTVANPGDDPLSSVVVSDDQCSPVILSSGDDNGNYALDPGEIWISTCSTVLISPAANTATATGIDSAGGLVSATDAAPMLIVMKDADDNDTVFDFTVTHGGNDDSLHLVNGEWAQLTDLATGSYTIAETVPADWKLASIACDNGIFLSAPQVPAVTISLQSGQDVGCTFTNRQVSYIFLPVVLRE